jgi:hypothetical protein
MTKRSSRASIILYSINILWHVNPLLEDNSEISKYTADVATRRPVNRNRGINGKILGFHGGDYEEWCLLGCYAVWLL